MKRAEWLFMLGKVFVRLLRLLNGLIEEDLVEAVDNLVSDRSTVAEGLCHLNSGPLSTRSLFHYTHGIRLRNLNLFLIQILVDEGASDIALLFDGRDVGDTPFLRDRREDLIGLVLRGLFPAACHFLLRVLSVCLDLAPIARLDVDFGRIFLTFLHGLSFNGKMDET